MQTSESNVIVGVTRADFHAFSGACSLAANLACATGHPPITGLFPPLTQDRFVIEFSEQKTSTAAALFGLPHSSAEILGATVAHSKIGYMSVCSAPPLSRPSDWTVWIDGERVNNVIAADDVAGYYIQHDLDANGRPKRDVASESVYSRYVTGSVSFRYHGNEWRYAAYQPLRSLGNV